MLDKWLEIPNQLIVKIVNTTPSIQGPTIIRSILGENVIESIEPLFPDDAESDLASLFKVTLESSICLKSSAVDLIQSDHIQYAHTAQKRNLSREGFTNQDSVVE